MRRGGPCSSGCDGPEVSSLCLLLLSSSKAERSTAFWACLTISLRASYRGNIFVGRASSLFAKGGLLSWVDVGEAG